MFAGNMFLDFDIGQPQNRLLISGKESSTPNLDEFGSQGPSRLGQRVAGLVLVKCDEVSCPE